MVEKQIPPHYGKGQFVTIFAAYHNLTWFCSVLRIKFFSLFSMLFVTCSETAFLLLTPYKSCAIFIPESHYFQSIFPPLDLCICCSPCLGRLLHSQPYLVPIHFSRSSCNAAFPRSLSCFICIRIHPHFRVSEPFLCLGCSTSSLSEACSRLVG